MGGGGGEQGKALSPKPTAKVLQYVFSILIKSTCSSCT
jgi:hypothetical protein